MRRPGYGISGRKFYSRALFISIHQQQSAAEAGRAGRQTLWQMNIVDNNGKLVYHYTTKETLLKILDNVSEGRFYLWAHNVFNMNDPKEVAYGFEKLWKLLPVIERRLDIEEDLKLSNIWNWDRTKTSQKLNEFLICEYSKLSNVPHAISLTSRGDSIPMWVMYADKGKGVAIGIDVANVFSWIDNGMIKREYEFKLDVPHAIRISYNASLNNETLINYIK